MMKAEGKIRDVFARAYALEKKTARGISIPSLFAFHPHHNTHTLKGIPSWKCRRQQPKAPSLELIQPLTALASDAREVYSQKQGTGGRDLCERAS
jgi:hypothetical protein